MSSPFTIIRDDLTAPAVLALLRDHLADVTGHAPPESTHALDVEALRGPDVSFWTAWDAGDLVGCGAIKALSATHGEIKSMRTAAGHLRRGVASAILRHLIAVAEARGYTDLSLETGSQPAFVAARALYARFDFVVCGPFGDYVADPNSVFMTRQLVGSRDASSVHPNEHA